MYPTLSMVVVSLLPHVKFGTHPAVNLGIPYVDDLERAWVRTAAASLWVWPFPLYSTLVLPFFSDKCWTKHEYWAKSWTPSFKKTYNNLHYQPSVLEWVSIVDSQRDTILIIELLNLLAPPLMKMIRDNRMATFHFHFSSLDFPRNRHPFLKIIKIIFCTSDGN